MLVLDNMMVIDLNDDQNLPFVAWKLIRKPPVSFQNSYQQLHRNEK